jgi:hypothetical protein
MMRRSKTLTAFTSCFVLPVALQKAFGYFDITNSLAVIWFDFKPPTASLKDCLK